MRCHSAAVAWLLLAGCASTPKAEPLPALVKVPVLEYVRVPDKLTAPCPVTRAKSRTVEAVVSAYHANVTALEACNEKLPGIRAFTARKSVVWGKRVSVRLDIGGPRIIKKKKKKRT